MSTPIPPKHNDNAFNLGNILWEGFKPLDIWININLVILQKTAYSALTKLFGKDLNFETVQKVGIVALLVVAAFHVGEKRTVLCVLATGTVSVLPVSHLVRRFLCTEVAPQDVKKGDYLILDHGQVHSSNDTTPVVSGRYERVQVIATINRGMRYMTAEGNLACLGYTGSLLKEPRYGQALDPLSFFGADIVDMDDYLAVGVIALLTASAALVNIRGINMLVLSGATQYLLRKHVATATHCIAAQKTVLKWITSEADQEKLSTTDELLPHHSVRKSKRLSPANALPIFKEGPSREQKKPKIFGKANVVREYGQDILTPQLRMVLADVISERQGKNIMQSILYTNFLTRTLQPNNILFNLTRLPNMDPAHPYPNEVDIQAVIAGIKCYHPAFDLPACADLLGCDALTFEMRMSLNITIKAFGETLDREQFVEDSVTFGRSLDLVEVHNLLFINTAPLLNIAIGTPQETYHFAANVIAFQQDIMDSLQNTLMWNLHDEINERELHMIASCMTTYQATVPADRAQLMRDIQLSNFFPNINWDDAWEGQFEQQYEGELQYVADLKALFTDLGREQAVPH